MKKIGLIVGCSHSAGAEIDGTHDSEYNRNHAFGSILCQMLGYEPFNISVAGATNSGIMRSILHWFNDCYDPNEMEVFVCVGWTESSRLEIPSPSDHYGEYPSSPWVDPTANHFMRINCGWAGSYPEERALIKIYQQFMAENPILLEGWSATNVLTIQYMLKSLNIPYVMCSTTYMFELNEPCTNFLVDKIDEKHYYNLKTDYHQAFYHKYADLGYENPKAVYWHHNEEPHRLFAEELYRFIGENNV
jgi:hypothetical protein